MLSGQIKKILIGILQKFVVDHQEKRKKVTNEDVQKFLSTH
jgi:tryptophanyl-tRNA synthetase